MWFLIDFRELRFYISAESVTVFFALAIRSKKTNWFGQKIKMWFL